MTSDLAIGLFDSGIGGLTVMNEVARLLPHENLVYLADTAHLPYGEKSPEAIVRYTLENSKFLLRQNIKFLIIACHTASTQALHVLQKTLSIPVLGMIEAGLEKLVDSRYSIKKEANIALLGTTSTIQSEIYQSLIQERCKNAKIFPIACPLFVPLIEEKLFDLKAFSLIAEYYLAPFKNKSIDLALLACTHYPMVQKHIQTILGSKVILVDPAKNIAIQTYKYLKDNRLLNTQNKLPSYQFYTTNNPEKFFQLARSLFDIQIKEVKQKD